MENIKQYVQQNKERFINELIELLKIPSVSADSAYAYVQKQVDFGPRVPGTAGHAACRDWLVSTLEGFADKVTTLDGSIELEIPRNTDVVGPFKTIEEMLETKMPEMYYVLVAEARRYFLKIRKCN